MSIKEVIKSLKDKFARRYYYGLFMNHNTRISTNSIPIYSFRADQLKLITISTNNIIETPDGFFRIVRRNSFRRKFDDETKRIFDVLKPLNIGMPERELERFVRREYKNRDYCFPFFRYNCFSANRSLAVLTIASYLGIDRLLTHVELCRIIIDGRITLEGTMASKATGVAYGQIKSDISHRMTPQLLQSLTNLNLLDVICFEKDHGANNYMNIIDENGRVNSICSFDNDSPSCFSISMSIDFKFTADGRPFVTPNGLCARPYLDKDVVERLMRIDLESLRKDLSCYLNVIQLYCCMRRIKQLQVAIQSSVEKGLTKLLNPNEWTQKMVDDEVKGINGRTYMHVLVDWTPFHKKEE